jgi:hypothetical protein
MRPAPVAEPAQSKAALAAGGSGECRRHPLCDLRCGCGSLLARRVAEGVELKCRRCKRTVVLPLAGV